MTKEEARAWGRSKRDRLTQQEHLILSSCMANVFTGFLTELEEDLKFADISCFLPIEVVGEPNTFFILDSVFKSFQDIRLSTTRIDGPDLEPITVSPNAEYELGRWDILFDPLAKPLGAFNYPLLVLIPLLAVDCAGNRVGYGKGFYDRFLATLPDNIIKMGISFFPPFPTEFSDVLRTDVNLDALLTPEKVIIF
jgi:5-formyltetrahydrofolate cyclo-ligase